MNYPLKRYFQYKTNCGHRSSLPIPAGEEETVRKGLAKIILDDTRNEGVKDQEHPHQFVPFVQ